MGNDFVRNRYRDISVTDKNKRKCELKVFLIYATQ